ncbi:MAG: type I phosphomannose isomerase catalytic subunit [Bulleidia sp.]|nr:class I mannose-6-phosphate isomerase [Erysipelotrichaceae bacterium]MDY2780400.1 type I phosphomannose isomerase catalytic subunit [Bulleidia sp.]
MNNKNNPLLLRPSGKDYLWGGKRLNDEFAKGIPMSPLAETWECSVHPDGPSYVVNQEFENKTLREVLEQHTEFLGTKHTNGFPLLIKFIDAKEDLSVQVHPDDEYAFKYENGERGKTEMWYVLDATKDATLIYGLKRDITKEELLKAITDNTLTKYLQYVPVKKGDVFFIEPGTIHAINAGALIVEIQESSNLTYRLYDYNRIDKNGKKRDLHIQKALNVARLTKAIEPSQPMRVLKYEQGKASELLCRSKYFEVYRMIINTERRQTVTYSTDDLSFKVLLCVQGCGTISYGNESMPFYKGDCIFVPANSKLLTIHGQAQFLDVHA